MNWKETYARYARCVYENSSFRERLARMIIAMDIKEKNFEPDYDPRSKIYPFLQDVIDAKEEPLPEWNLFLKEWQEALKNQTRDREFILFLEATYFLEGSSAVEQEVKKRKNASGYLYLLDTFIVETNWEKIRSISEKALDIIPSGEQRKEIAKKLSLAGKNLRDDACILQGKREIFYSIPEETELAILLKEALRQKKRDEELKNALNFIEKNTNNDDLEEKINLKVKILFMLGDLKTAFQHIDSKQCVGWSYDSTGTAIFFSGLMVVLGNTNTQTFNINSLLQKYAGIKYLSSISEEDEEDNDEENTVSDIILQEIQQGLMKIAIDQKDKDKWIKWAEKIADARIGEIVSNKYRKAYPRAAQVLGALMECYVLNDNPNKAKELLNAYRNEKYSQFRAFRREVDDAIKASPLFKNNF